MYNVADSWNKIYELYNLELLYTSSVNKYTIPDLKVNRVMRFIPIVFYNTVDNYKTTMVNADIVIKKQTE